MIAWFPIRVAVPWFLFTLLALMLLDVSLGDEVGKLRGRLTDGKSSRSYSVPEGKLVEVLNFTTARPNSADPRTITVAWLVVDGIIVRQARLVGDVADDRTNTFIPGPAKFHILTPRGSDVNYYCSFKIADNPPKDKEAETQKQQPAQPIASAFNGYPVVIPEDESGEVEIRLETSGDLVSWVVANPGVYESSAALKRFFRVRAIRRK
jgi:hypothetical protein